MSLLTRFIYPKTWSLVEGGNVIKVEKKSNRIARDSSNGVSSWPGKKERE